MPGQHVEGAVVGATQEDAPAGIVPANRYRETVKAEKWLDTTHWVYFIRDNKNIQVKLYLIKDTQYVL